MNLKKEIALFSLAVGLILSFLVFKISTNDIFYHVKAGQWIVEHKKIFSDNIFSYTSAKEKLINHEPLAQVIFFIWSQLLGFNSLIILKILVVFLIFFIYFRTTAKSAISVRLFSALVLLFLLRERLYIRPEMFAMLLAFYLLYLVRYARYTKARPFLFLLKLFLVAIVWVNIHLSFVIGFVILGVSIMVELIKKQKELVYIYTIGVIVFLVGTIINPNGIELYNRVLWEFTKPSYSAYIAEWVSPLSLSWAHMTCAIFVFYGYIIVWLILFFLSRKKDLAGLLLFIGLALIALKYRRFIALFGLLTIIDFSRYLDEFCTKFKMHKILLWIYICLSFIVLYLQCTNKLYIYERVDIRMGLGINYLTQPVNAVDFLEKQRVKYDRIFNSFDFGNYLIFRLFPLKKVFINGNFFNEKSMLTYKTIMQHPERYFPLAEKIFKIDLVILKYVNLESEKLIKYLQSHWEWGLLYFDGLAIIFLKRYTGEVHEGFLRSPTKIYPEDYINKGLLFALLEEYTRAEKYLKEGLKLRPRDYTIYNNLANIYCIQGRYAEAVNIYKKLLNKKKITSAGFYNYKKILLKIGQNNEGKL